MRSCARTPTTSCAAATARGWAPSRPPSRPSIAQAVEASHPRTRYVVTPAAKAQVQLRRLGGDRLWDAFVSRAYRMR